MSWLSVVSRDEGAPAVAETLENLLAIMERYGNPRVAKYDTGWFCAVDVRVSAIGASFEVKSDFNNRSPVRAAVQCRDRLLAAVRSLGAA